jgi:tubulin-specific chaperone D
MFPYHVPLHQNPRLQSNKYTLNQLPSDIVRFLPNEVYLLEPVLTSLSTPNLQWQTTYILILWLSLICLAPFDLASIESSSAGESLVTRLLALAKRGLGSPGKERDASAILCARVLSRGDVWRVELAPFMIWSIHVFSSSEDNVLLVTSCLGSTLM